jgi:hypothetical protein
LLFDDIEKRSPVVVKVNQPSLWVYVVRLIAAKPLSPANGSSTA